MRCPYCNSEKHTDSYMQGTVFNNKSFEYLSCSDCSVIYIHPFPNDEDYIKMYPPSYQGELISSANLRYDNLFQLLKLHHPSAKTIIDYGCGNAEFLVSAQKFDYKCSGLEYNNDFVKSLRNNFPEFQFFEINEFEKDIKSYDIIVLNNVLEHVTNPNELLSLLHSRLNENGLLVVLGPIEENFTVAQIFRRFLFGLRKKISSKKANHIPYHITFTNVVNQKAIFNRNNFKEVYFSTGEVAWPFPENINYKSVKSILLGSIANFSKITSKIFNKKAGNTFIYIGLK